MDDLRNWELVANTLLGVAYALFGKGPNVPHVPAFGLAMLRLIAPMPLICLSVFQWAYGPSPNQDPTS